MWYVRFSRWRNFAELSLPMIKSRLLRIQEKKKRITHGFMGCLAEWFLYTIAAGLPACVCRGERIFRIYNAVWPTCLGKKKNYLSKFNQNFYRVCGACNDCTVHRSIRRRRERLGSCGKKCSRQSFDRYNNIYCIFGLRCCAPCIYYTGVYAR